MRALRHPRARRCNVATASRAARYRDVTYRVQKGDSLDLIAAEFYGDRNDAIFIMVENKMQQPRKLNPGERLRIPVTREIRTEKGDTFESLAQRYLGDSKRAPFLAEFNGIVPSRTRSRPAPS